MKVLRNRKFPAMTGWSALLGLVTVVVGLPIAGGIAAGIGTLTAKVTGVAAGVLFLISCLLVGRGVSRSEVDGRLFRYFGGLAQLVRGEPEPRVVRWADVGTFTVSFSEPDESTAHPTGFTLHTVTGTWLPGLRRYRQPDLHELVTAISRAVAPHLVPAMTKAYDSGEPAIFGSVRVDQAGITAGHPGSEAEPIPWDGISAITVTHLPGGGLTRLPHMITITRAGGHAAREIGLSAVPNGVFLPQLLAHAAPRNGVPVYGYLGAHAGRNGEVEQPGLSGGRGGP